MAEVNSLLEEDEDDENSKLLNFYQGNLSFLNQDPLCLLPDELKFQAAALYFGTSEYENEWKGVLEDLGVDYITMYGIDFASRSTGNLPIYLALNGILQSNTSLGDFINVLCKREKFHILRHLKSFVKELLRRRHSANERDSCSRPRPSAPDFSLLEATAYLADSCNLEGNSPQPVSGYHSVIGQGVGAKDIQGHKTSLEHLQNSEAIYSFVNKSQLSAVANSKNNQSSDESISVFIMHSMLDKRYAKKLAAYLKKKNFKVLTSAHIFPYLRVNHTTIMAEIDKKADFVIIVVSESLLMQINSSGSNATGERDIESEANAFMYDRLLNEFCRKKFRNLRVKPVTYSLKTKKLENNDRILSFSFYLPKKELKNDQLLDTQFLRHLRHSQKLLGLSN